jgi:peptidoglycan hydrolase-like protein with peptidoglycan-binding domain
MKKSVFIILALVLAVSIFGCGKKEKAGEEPLTMDTLGMFSNETLQAPGITPETKTLEVQAPVAPAATPVTVEPLSVSGASKPTSQEIQTALKNAGYYSGAIDGKMGPRTQKAIEDFQQANGLKVDGKVGPMTWAALSKYLSATTGSGTATSQP